MLGTSESSTSQTPAAGQRQPEQPAPGQPGEQPRAEPHAAGQPEEDGREQHAVRRGAAAEVDGELLAQPDHQTTGRERAEHADDQPADQRRAADEAPALDDGPPQRLLARRSRLTDVGKSSRQMTRPETR